MFWNSLVFAFNLACLIAELIAWWSTVTCSLNNERELCVLWLIAAVLLNTRNKAERS